MQAQYDCIIVGGGISGMCMAKYILQKHPKWCIAVAERYKGLGGRTYSYTHNDITWEMGAGRVYKDHVHTMKLIHEYGLTWMPISDYVEYKAGRGIMSIENPFPVLSKVYIQPLQELSADILRNSTIETLMKQVYGPLKSKEILSYFPYRSEVTTMRADLALASILTGNLSTHSGYGIIKEGFSELILRMKLDLEKKGCNFLPRHYLRDLQAVKGSESTATDCTFDFGYPESSHGSILLRAKKAVVLALHKDAVAELKMFRGWKTLDYLQTTPLLRIYGQFKKPWFTTIKHTVTPGPLRYIIPLNPQQGTIMLSYTDNDDTKVYNRIYNNEGEKGLQKRIMKDIRALFPELVVDDPQLFKVFYWATGTTYWTPGNYSPEVLSQSSVHPLPKVLPNVWLCGESWSTCQAWVEGAVKQTILCHKELERTL
jgi:hypothetical protein